MADIDVSVIVSVYNGEKYLKKCLNSLQEQTLENIEIICINDGSTDNSLKILNDYANNDNRIKVISKENAGAGSARNIGLDNVNGKYVSFVDADDWVDLDMLEKLYNISESKGTDIVIFKMLDYDEKNHEFYKSKYYKIRPLRKFSNQLFKTKDIGNKLFNVTTSTANKFYNAKFLKKAKTSFPEGFIFEDNPFFFDLMLKANKIFFLDKYIYYRRRRESSIMSSINDTHFGIIPVTNIIIDVFKNNDSLEDYKNGLFNFKISSIKLRYNIMDDNFKNRFFPMIKEDLEDFYNKYNKDDGYNEKNEYKKNIEPSSRYLKNILKENNYNFLINSLNAKSSKEFQLLNKVSILNQENKMVKNENKKLQKELEIYKSRKVVKMINKLQSLVKR